MAASPTAVTSRKAVVVASLLVSVTVAKGDGRALHPAVEALTDAELKHAYLSCSCEALRQTPRHGEIMFCSIIYERLKAKVFTGDFGRLLDWSRAQSTDHCVAMENTPS